MANPTNDQTSNENSDPSRPASVTDGPPQIRENEDDGVLDRQIAQQKQQSTGQGTGQS